MTYEELKDALSRYFGDTRRSPEETREGLENLRDEIDMLLETLP
jgi:hypothetical protein